MSRAQQKQQEQQQEENDCHNFDLFRISKAKKTVDLSPNTIRAYVRQGLRSYKSGKILWISRADLRHFITTKRAA